MDINTINDVASFLKTDIRQIEKDFSEKDEKWWQEQGEKSALNLFAQAAKRIPAYKKFLIVHKINPQTIKTYKDFQKVPYTDKKNYIDKYPLEELVWDAKVAKNLVINASSGTMGSSYFWPGSIDKIVRGAVLKELVFKNNFNVDKKTTLLIICFGMGTWIAGSYTFVTAQMISLKGYPLTTITPGFNKEETLRILSQLSPKYEQTIIAGPPTFIKDLIEQWKQTKESKLVKDIKFDFAAEGFPEEFREYLLDLVNSKDDYNDAINIYGSADATLMGFETAMSIAMRKKASNDENLRTKLFAENRLPALYAFLPTLRFFESENKELLLTADLGIPLIRYNIHDQGGIIPASQIKSALKDSPHKEKSNLPFVYIFGRGKFTATLYAANIYPEYIREVLFAKAIREFVTGNFVISTKYTKNQDHYLELNVELAEDVMPSDNLTESITKVFVATVKRLSTEYNRIYQEYGVKAEPKVVLHKYGDADLFPKDKMKKSA